MSKIKSFSDQLNELKRNTVVTINNALNELEKLKKEGNEQENEVKTFSDDPKAVEFVQNIMNESIQNTVQNAVQEAVQEAVQNAINDNVQVIVNNAVKNEMKRNQFSNKRNTCTDATNVAQVVTDMVNLPQEAKTDQVTEATDAVAEVANELMANNLSVNTVQNAINALNQAVEDAPEEAKDLLENAINQIDTVVSNQPRTFSDSLNQIMKQEKSNKPEYKDDKEEGQEKVETELNQRKVASQLSPALRRMLNMK